MRDAERSPQWYEEPDVIRDRLRQEEQDDVYQTQREARTDEERGK